MELGLGEEFWGLTPRDFRELLDVKRKRDELEAKRGDFRAGVIAAVIVNTTPSKTRSSAKPADFFPSLVEGQDRVGRSTDPEALAAVLKGWAKAHND